MSTHSPQVFSRIQKSEALIRRMDRLVDGISMKSDARSRLSAGCFCAAQDHQKAITLLIANHIYGAAAALARPLFESYVRGVWLHRCATEEDLASYQANDSFSNPKLLKQIEKVEGFESGVLTEIGGKHWASLCSFAHSGVLQSMRYNKEDSIEPDFEDGVLLELIHLGDTIGLMAGMGIAHLTNNHQLAMECLNEMRAI